jgi:hypothetical protein
MTVAQQYTNPIISYENSATIASLGRNSSAVTIGSMTICGLIMPATWTAATLSMEMSIDNGVTWHQVYDNDGTQIVLTVDASRYVKLDPADFAGINTLRLVSSADQAEERTIVIAARPV